MRASVRGASTRRRRSIIGFLIMLAIVLITVAFAQKYQVFGQAKRDLTSRWSKKPAGAPAKPPSEYDVPEPEPLPPADEILYYLWALDRDRSLIDRFL